MCEVFEYRPCEPILPSVEVSTHGKIGPLKFSGSQRGKRFTPRVMERVGLYSVDHPFSSWGCRLLGVSYEFWLRPDSSDLSCERAVSEIGFVNFCVCGLATRSRFIPTSVNDRKLE